MVRPTPLLILLLASALVAESTTGDSTSDWTLAELAGGELGGIDVASHECGGGEGLVGECGEMSMESEVSRRVLMTARNYISYGALVRDRIPCSHRGHSYYGCQGHKRANPYRRGCSMITRCARILH